MIEHSAAIRSEGRLSIYFDGGFAVECKNGCCGSRRVDVIEGLWLGASSMAVVAALCSSTTFSSCVLDHVRK